MKLALEKSNAAEIICANYYKNTYGDADEQIAQMLYQDFGLRAYSGPVHKNLHPDTTINEIVEYICKYILGRPDGPFSVEVDVFNAFMELELTLAREDEDYEDEAAEARCEESRLAR